MPLLLGRYRCTAATSHQRPATFFLSWLTGTLESARRDRYVMSFNRVNLDSPGFPLHHSVKTLPRTFCMQMLRVQTEPRPSPAPTWHIRPQLILLTPQYVPAVQRRPVSTRAARRALKRQIHMCLASCVGILIIILHQGLQPPYQSGCFLNKHWVRSDLKASKSLSS